MHENQPVDYLKKDKESIKWQDAVKHMDKYVETEGTIISSFNSGKICFLNFSKDYKNTLTLVIFADDLRRFPANPEQYYKGRKISVQGRIKDYKGKVEIVLKSSDQIKLLDK
jgi:micrococcal nuclease